MIVSLLQTVTAFCAWVSICAGALASARGELAGGLFLFVFALCCLGVILWLEGKRAA